MIEFKCHCSQPISVADDQAGGLIQCPSCGRLNDIPTLSDLKNLDADGNFKLTELEIVDEPKRLKRLTEAFTRDRFDDEGEEIDLRPSMEDVARAGVEEIPLATDEKDLVGAPKYDPITGELVEAIKIKPEPKDADYGPIPMATPVLGYAGTSADDPRGWTLLRVGLELFKPINIAVIAIVMFIQVLLGIAVIPLAGGIFFLAPLVLLPAMVILAYFGKVIVETGPGEQDELPRPLGDLDFRDDLWNPFVGVAGAYIISFAPLIALRIFGGAGAPLTASAGLVALGALLYPAVLLTILTSGSVFNLRPDRVIAVALRCGPPYLFVVLLFVAAIIAESAGARDVMRGISNAFRPGKVNYSMVEFMISVVGWMGGMFLTLWGCWSLGILYRRHHDRFPWVLQKHTYRNRTRRGMPPRGVRPPGGVKSRR